MTAPTAWSAARSRRWLRNCTQLGDAPHLVGKPTIDARSGSLQIGHRFRFSSRPVASHLVAGPGAVLQIGDDVSIGCGAAIAAFQRVHIGDGTHIGPFVIIMDTNFHSAPGDQSVQHDCRPVTIGRNCRIGSRVTITRGVTIGDGVEILAGSVVASKIPSGFCAAGGRARIIGRAGEVTSTHYGAAVVLPELLMHSLDLEAAPELDDSAIPAQPWTTVRMQRLISTIENQLGVVLSADSVYRSRTFADIAAAVQHALQERLAHSLIP